MFEIAETGQSIDKAEFRALEPEMHHRLLQLQQQLRQSDKSLIIIVSGVEGAGKGEVVDRLNRWFDTRDVQTNAFFDTSDEEKERPRHWRFWRALPARGTVGVMFGSWYTAPIVDRVYENISDDTFDDEMSQITALERMLTLDGHAIVKLWFHLPHKEQKRRVKQDIDVAKLKKGPLLKKYSKSYKAFAAVSEQAISATDTEVAPWHIIESTDRRYRDITTGEIIAARLESLLGEVTPRVSPVPMAAVLPDAPALADIDLSLSMDDSTFDDKLAEVQNRLHELAWQMHDKKRNALLVFEGWDAAGKGSAIRRLTAAFDARLYRVIPIAAPSDEEKAHHYLWRFWRHVPRSGYLTIFDRSWYGRVLVERVEGFASEDEWQRSFAEIRSFEKQLASHGAAVLKFWLHISPEEQLARFEARQEDPRKKHKITEEDWRNREKWNDYVLAVDDMMARTSTPACPWTVISGNDKKVARIQVLETVRNRLEKLVG